eukprot:1137881-Pelagomonas_calceolata.AAC.3
MHAAGPGVRNIFMRITISQEGGVGKVGSAPCQPQPFHLFQDPPSQSAPFRTAAPGPRISLMPPSSSSSSSSSSTMISVAD